MIKAWDCKTWMVLLGGLLLLVGLWMGLWSARMSSAIMGDTNLGYGQWAPEAGSPEDLAKRAKRARADGLFYGSLVFTAVGVVLQTIAALP